MLATKLAELGHFQLLFHFFLVALGVMRDTTTFGTLHLHQGIFDLSHSLCLLSEKNVPILREKSHFVNSILISGAVDPLRQSLSEVRRRFLSYRGKLGTCGIVCDFAKSNLQSFATFIAKAPPNLSASNFCCKSISVSLLQPLSISVYLLELLEE